MGAVKNNCMDGFRCGESVSVCDVQMSAQDGNKSDEQMSAQAGSNSRVTPGIFLISPYDPRYRAWKTFLIMLTFYSVWVSPFEFAFIEEQKGGLFVADLIVDFFFAIDIIMTFYVPYLDRRTYSLVDRRKSIAKRYLCTWFIFDVCSTVPYEADTLMFRGRSTGLPTKVLGFLRFWRLRRIISLFASLEMDVRFNYFWTRCAKLTCVILFAIHCAGCLKYLLAARHGDKTKTWIGAIYPDFINSSLGSRYVTTIYLSSINLIHGGYGDLRAQNTVEMIVDFLLMLLNLALTGYLMGNITNLFDGTSQTKRFREAFRAASRFFSRNQLPRDLQEQILAHLRLKLRTEDLQQEIFLSDLPKPIREHIANSSVLSIIEKVYLFQGVSKHFLLQLVSETNVVDFLPGKNVILKGEEPTFFYVLVSGAVEILADKDKDNHKTEQALQTIEQCHKGDVFGEIGVLCYRPQPYTVRTKMTSRLLRLKQNLFMDLVKSNIADTETIMNNLLQHGKELKDPIFGETSKEIKRSLVKGSGTMDVPVSLCSVASIGHTIVMEQLLKNGMDPNESDSNSRTPLHIATAHGFEDCVKLLLQYRADVDSKDKDGSVPLWEAIQGRHESIAKLLWKYGANLRSGSVGNFLCVAAQKRDFDMLKDLLRYGADINATNGDGNTALQVAISNSNGPIKVVEYLLDNGADRNKTDVRMRSISNLGVGRVTVHAHRPIYKKSDKQPGKLIRLPDSIRELLEIGGEKFRFSPAKVLNEESAEIDDIRVIRDGDHLFLVAKEEFEDIQKEE